MPPALITGTTLARTCWDGITSVTGAPAPPTGGLTGVDEVTGGTTGAGRKELTDPEPAGALELPDPELAGPVPAGRGKLATDVTPNAPGVCRPACQPTAAATSRPTPAPTVTAAASRRAEVRTGSVRPAQPTGC
jgi:hypothetical protein